MNLQRSYLGTFRWEFLFWQWSSKDPFFSCWIWYFSTFSYLGTWRHDFTCWQWSSREPTWEPEDMISHADNDPSEILPGDLKTWFHMLTMILQRSYLGTWRHDFTCWQWSSREPSIFSQQTWHTVMPEQLTWLLRIPYTYSKHFRLMFQAYSLLK